MNFASALTDRNREHATAHPGAPSGLVPTRQAVLLTCCDHRVDPAHVLGLGLDEAIVIRNAGGRVNPEVIRNLVALSTVVGLENLELDPEIILIQHTDCGTSRFVGEKWAPFVGELLGIDEGEAAAYRLDDPRAAVRIDVQRLRTDALIPDSITLTGMVYDVATGRVDIVVTSPGQVAA